MSETQIVIALVAGLALLIVLLFRKNLRRLGLKLPGAELTAEMGPSEEGQRTPPDPAITANTGPVAAGERSAAAGGHAITTGDRANVSISNTDEKTLDKMLRLAKQTGALEGKLETSEREKADLRRRLAAAVARTEKQAKKGDAPARAALDEARTSGDVAKLQAVLIAEAGRQEGQVKEAATDYVELCREIAAVAYLRGDIAEAESRLKVVLRFIPDDLDAINRTGHIHLLRGELGAALRSYTLILEKSGGDDGWRAIAYGNLGLIEETRGNLKAAEKYHKDALEIDKKLESPGGMAAAYGNLGLIEQRRGNLEAAEKYLKKALEIHTKQDSQADIALDYGNLGLLERMRGNLDAAEKYHKDSLDIEKKLGRLEGMAVDYGNLGLIEQMRGNLDAAEKYNKDALEIFTKLGSQEGMANQYGNLGLIEKTRGNLDAAEKYHKDALEIEKKLGRLEGIAADYGNLGTIEWTRGNFDSARALWLKARDTFAKVGMPHKVEQVQLCLDELPPEGEGGKGGAKPR